MPGKIGRMCRIRIDIKARIGILGGVPVDFAIKDILSLLCVLP